jgi:hypothetical protein
MQGFRSVRYLCLGLLAFALNGSSATFYPYLDPVQDEITNQLAFLRDTNNVVEGRTAQIRQLNQALNFLQRRGRVSLQSDLQKLATVSALLTRNANADLYEPLLVEAAQNYSTALLSSADSLSTRLEGLPPSRDVTAAMNALDSVNSTLESAQATSDPTLAARLLSRGSLRLLAIEASLTRLNRPTDPILPDANGLRAFINGESFTADTAPLATFSSGTGILTIRGSQNLGSETRSLTLTISGVRDGRTVVERLGETGRGSYAIYTRSGTNTAGYTSTTGSATVTLDLATGVATGTFNFLGTARSGQATPVQVSGGNFIAPVR